MESITYLIANYNNGKYIEDCLNSLLEQTNPNWLAIIVDDSSTDNSIEKIQPFLSSKIQLFKNEQNIGYILTLCKLIKQASTDIIGILDSDDALYPAATEEVLKAYTENTEAGFVYTDLTFFDEHLQTPININSAHSTAIIKNGSTLWGGFVAALRTFRVSIYRKTKGLDTRILYAEDRDLIYKMEEVTSLVFVNQCLYKYRKVPNSHTNSLKKRQIGIDTHRLAYKNALARRNIRGLKKLIYLMYFQQRYTSNPFLPAVFIPVGRSIRDFFLRSWR